MVTDDMSPDLSHLRVTVVDFMGVLLPGTVWTVLIAVLGVMSQDRKATTPLTFVQELLIAPQPSVNFYVATTLLVLIVGYVVKNIAVGTSEILARSLDAPFARMRLLLGDGKGRTINADDLRFPYHALHLDTPYYRRILEFVESRLGVSWASIPRAQVFATCKRILKLYAARLWEEAEYREAEVRMLAALFLASLFNLALLGMGSVLDGKINWIAVFTSFAAALLLGRAFRIRRYREVESVYFATLSVLALVPANAKPPVSAAAVTPDGTPPS